MDLGRQAGEIMGDIFPNLGRERPVNIILASGSPRRKELLKLAGLENFIVAPTEVDETIEEGATPDEVVRRLSQRKAAGADFPSCDIVIAADTVVCIDDRILGKPRDENEAVEMLMQLSGRTHIVYTGVTLRRGSKYLTEVERTSVRFRELDDKEIHAYVKTGEPMDKAGAYGIQGRGCTFAEYLEGDYFNVMGLPMARLAMMLKKFGVMLLK